jgi:ABC-type nitrate/sulfonate/bicarbonate transport system substrate-binding protein
MKVFKSQIGTPPYTIYANSAITSIAQLKGKKVMIGGPKDVTRYYVETLFSRHGLQPGTYDYLYAGSTANRFAALVSGGIDATIVLPPLSYRAKAQGFTNLGNIQTVLADFPFTVHAYNTDWAKTHRPALVAYTAALLKATAWLYDTRHREEAADILVKATRFKKPDALLNYDTFIKEMKAISRDGKVTEDAYSKMMKVLIGWGDVKAPVPPIAKFYDSSILADAARTMSK